MARLLLVEDEQVNRDLFRRRLERKGYTVLTADSGLVAVALAQSDKPDLVLMDLGLPDIDGWEATKRVKADATTTAIPVIVLSAHATSDAKEKAFAAGCQDFETKPVNWDVLFRKIDEWLAKAEAARKAEEEAARARAQTEATAVLPAPQPGTRPRPSLSAMLAGAGATTETLVALPKPVVPEPPSPDKEKQEKDVCAVHPKRILVVEDNDANRVMLCRRLNKHGYATAEAANGREALEYIYSQRFDLVLCDIMMPEMDGYAVLREIKSDPDMQPLPIIMLSALDEMAGIVQCIELGAEDYLQKPYDPILLHARINACLDKRRLRDQELAYLKAVTALTQAAELVEKGEFDPELLAPVAERNDNLGTLARVFDRMAREVQTRMKQMQADMRQMTKVEIDTREVVHEVARVTQSDAFEKARRQAEETRVRRQQLPKPNPMTETMILKAPPK